jgi:hypothetical protein
VFIRSPKPAKQRLYCSKHRSGSRVDRASRRRLRPIETHSQHRRGVQRADNSDTYGQFSLTQRGLRGTIAVHPVAYVFGRSYIAFWHLSKNYDLDVRCASNGARTGNMPVGNLMEVA